MATLVWESRYNCHSAIVGILTLHVDWVDGGGYRVSIQGARTLTLKKLSPTVDDGKTRAIDLACKTLEQMLTQLEAL